MHLTLDSNKTHPNVSICICVISMFALVACSTSVGLRRAPNPWTQHCAHGQLFLTAADRQDQAAMRSAAAQLRSDIEPMQRDSPVAGSLASAVAAAAEADDIERIRQHVAGNCLPITPVPAQTAVH